MTSNLRDKIAVEIARGMGRYPTDDSVLHAADRVVEMLAAQGIEARQGRDAKQARAEGRQSGAKRIAQKGRV